VVFSYKKQDYYQCRLSYKSPYIMHTDLLGKVINLIVISDDILQS